MYATQQATFIKWSKFFITQLHPTRKYDKADIRYKCECVLCWHFPIPRFSRFSLIFKPSCQSRITSKRPLFADCTRSYENCFLLVYHKLCHNHLNAHFLESKQLWRELPIFLSSSCFPEFFHNFPQYSTSFLIIDTLFNCTRCYSQKKNCDGVGSSPCQYVSHEQC